MILPRLAAWSNFTDQRCGYRRSETGFCALEGADADMPAHPPLGCGPLSDAPAVC